jgi:glutaredoxin
MKIRGPIAVFALTAAFAASAQQIYRWTDEKGRVHITDTPPPASARNVQKKAATARAAGEQQQPFELAQAMREFPVTLYTTPACNEPCVAARALLNKRGVPFKEVQVGDEPSRAELQKVSGAEDIPTLLVGRSVHRGFAQDPYDALLDAARYPRAGLLTPRAQAAPPKPESDPDAAKPAAAAPSGPYAPRPRGY